MAGGSDNCSAAAQALIEIGDPRAVPLLAPHLRHRVFYVRQMAACAIGQIPHPDAARLLIPLLRDEHQHVRETVILALGHVRDPAAIEPLIEMLRTTQDPWEPTHIARALGEIGDPRAIPALQGCLNHKDSTVRREAGEAIRSIQAKANPPREESH